MILSPVSAGDLDELHALSADPRVWEHLPSGAHTSLEQTRDLLDFMIAGWAADGLSFWTVRTDDGEYIGYGGPRLIHDGQVWNVGYRIRPEFWGRGIGRRIAVSAIDAIHAHDPDRPVTAKLLEHNEASRRTAESAGLALVWRGPEAGIPGAIRLVYADRELTAEQLTAVTAHPAS